MKTSFGIVVIKHLTECAVRRFLELERVKALSANTKVFFGPDIPQYFQSLGGVGGSGPHE